MSDTTETSSRKRNICRYGISKSTRYRLRKKAKLLTLTHKNNSAVEFEPISCSPHRSDNINVINDYSETSSETIHNESLDNTNNTFSSDSSNSSIIEFDSNDEDEPDSEFDLNKTIALWALRHQIPHIVLNDLLKNLRKNNDFKSLPKDARTLLKTPKNTVVKNIDGGIYYHFGIKEEVKLLIDLKYNLPENLSLVVSIDGLPITKNPPSNLWPILDYFLNIDEIRPNVFLIGAFFGRSKPVDSNEFLLDFVNEMKNILTNGITVESKHYSIEIKALLCDAPAKSFVLKVQGRTGIILVFAVLLWVSEVMDVFVFQI